MTAAARASLDVVGLTDHDTWAGWSEAAGQVPASGVALLRGVEVSASRNGTSVHVLALLPDPERGDLAALMERSRRGRDRRGRIMAERLAEDFPITWEQVRASAGPGATVGRPHLADTLVAAGVVTDRSAAFQTILAPSSRYYVHHEAPDPIVVVEAIVSAGGVPILAHPRAASRAGQGLSVEQIGELVDAGLFALEADHREHDERARAEVREIAARFGLPTTGASDYHGEGKPNRLGEHLTDREVFARIEDAGAIAVIRP